MIPAARLAGVACVIIPEPFLTGSALMELFNVKPAENAVAELLVRGMTPDECALHLGVSIATIRTHLSALYRKPILVISRTSADPPRDSRLMVSHPQE